MFLRESIHLQNGMRCPFGTNADPRFPTPQIALRAFMSSTLASMRRNKPTNVSNSCAHKPFRHFNISLGFNFNFATAK